MLNLHPGNESIPWDHRGAQRCQEISAQLFPVLEFGFRWVKRGECEAETKAQQIPAFPQVSPLFGVKSPSLVAGATGKQQDAQVCTSAGAESLRRC